MGDIAISSIAFTARIFVAVHCVSSFTFLSNRIFLLRDSSLYWYTISFLHTCNITVKHYRRLYLEQLYLSLMSVGY
jgi:hypothetical protein